MRRPPPLLLVWTAALASGLALAQPPPDTLDAGVPADALEALAEGDAAGDATDLVERLAALRAAPLDVNTAAAAALAEVPALGPRLGAAVVRRRLAAGPFATVADLLAVPGLTADVLREARPYLTVGPGARPARFPTAPALGAVLRGLRPTALQRVQRRLDVGAGYSDSTRVYPGSPTRIVTRLRARYRRQVSVALTLEKDPGEPFRFGDGAVGYDHVGGHLAVLDAGRVDALVVGDFAAEVGQGLVLWRGSGFGKGPDAVGGPVRTGRGLRPYASVDETAFFRGAGATLSVLPALAVTAFASRRARDATRDSAGVTSLAADGLHRTERERARRGALAETLVGGGAELRLSTAAVQGRLGAVGTRARFDAPLVPADGPDGRFDLAGDAVAAASVYADATTEAVTAFGEVARAGGGLGAIGGLGVALGGGAEVLVVGRRYDPGFQSLHGYPFGERNGVGQNERGVYAGLRLRPGPRWTVDAYLDQYAFPVARRGAPRPSRGTEALVRVEHRPARYVTVTIQGRTETREAGLDVPNVAPGSAVGGLADETRSTLRVQGEWAAGGRLRLRARVEGARYVAPDGAVETGTLLYPDVRWQARRGLRADARLALFSTDGFGARLYAFENDLTGVFAVPALSGRGVRAYVLLTARPAPGVTAQLKLASTWLRGVSRIGSGADAVAGQRVREVGGQVVVRL